MFNVTYPDLQSAYLALLQLGGIRNDTLADVYGDQKLYNDRTQAMETELLARLVQVRAGKAELPSLLSVIQELGAQRHALAAEMQSDHAADFGTSRMVGFEIHPSMITHLIMARYRLANEAIKVDMLVRIKELLARDKRQLVWTTATSRYTFERMNAQDMRAFVKEMGRPHDTLAETRSGH